MYVLWRTAGPRAELRYIQAVCKKNFLDSMDLKDLDLENTKSQKQFWQDQVKI